MKLKRASIFTIVVILALIVYAGVGLMNKRAQVSQALQARQELQEQVDQLSQENAELQYEIDHSADDETLEDIARDKLGLVKPGEKIFYDVSN